MPRAAQDDPTDMRTSVVTCPSETRVYGVGAAYTGLRPPVRLVIDENWTANATLTAASVTA